MYKNILVLGASGATGKELVRLATRRGYKVTALLRSVREVAQPDDLEVVQGDVLDEATLEQVVAGKDAVMSCLGIRRNNASNPWSALLSPPDFLELSGRNIVGAMQKNGVNRLIAISAAGAGDSIDKVDAVTRLLFQVSNLSTTLRDSERMETLYADSGLDTIVMRPVRLVDGPASERAQQIDRCRFTSKISRGDVAQWMLDALERPGQFATRSEMIGWS